jgi:orotate phosphoribosyltransferase
MLDAKAREEMQERGLLALHRNGGFKFTHTFFPYTSGQIGNYFIQSVDVTGNAGDYSGAINDLASVMRDKGVEVAFDDHVISGGESRDWDFSNPIAVHLRLAHAKLYKDGRMIGADVAGKDVFHVADLNNEGSSPRDFWFPALRDAGADVKGIFFYVDRMEDGVQVMKDEGVPADAVVPLNGYAWGFLQQQDVVSAELYRSLMDRLVDKDVWAEDMLRSEAGIEEMARLLRDPQMQSKALKVLNYEGYSGLKDELVERLEPQLTEIAVLEAASRGS